MNTAAPATNPPITTGHEHARLAVRAGDAVVTPDDAEWRAVIASLRPVLVQEARRLCRGHVDADDLVQVAIMRAMNTRAPLRDPAKLTPWLVRILTNAFLDENRRQRRAPAVPIDATHDLEAPVVEPAAWDGITDDELRAAIAALPDDVRETFVLFELERCSYDELSRRLAVPSGTIGTRLRRARKHLRLILQQRSETR